MRRDNNDELRSENGKFNLVIQDDGSLVLYFRAFALTGLATYGRGDRFRLDHDGRLVLLDAANSTLWKLDTDGRGDHLVLENNSNLVLYDRNGVELLSTNINFSEFHF